MRAKLIKLHLYVAAFFLPMLVAMAVSGGLYLTGNKGSTARTEVEITAPQVLLISSETLETDVRDFLKANQIDHDFEYVKVSGSTLTTRQTSVKADQLSQVEPDWIKVLVELHKGHGPLWYKDLQKLMALGLLFVLISGVWLGVSSPTLRTPTLLSTVAGSILFIVLGFLI
ncbi:MAG: hypothetical protein ACPHAN_12615 [Pseudomonadales bacterium]